MTTEGLLQFLGQMLAYGGGSAAVAYLLFQWLGKTWIENKFAQRLDQLRHQQALELQKLRVEIDAMLSGALKLQEKEFSVLPEAWAKLDEAHGLVAWLVSPTQRSADVGRMNSVQLEEFLANTEFAESQKDEVRHSHDKDRTYQGIVFWQRLHKVKKAFGELQGFVARNGIFSDRGTGREVLEDVGNALVSRHLQRSRLRGERLEDAKQELREENPGRNRTALQVDQGRDPG